MNKSYHQNGFCTVNSSALPLHDAGFVLGATVADLVRTAHHELFRFDEHLARFRQSCALCRVPLEKSDTEIRAIADELVTHNTQFLPPNGDLGLVMYATPGPVGFYAGLPGGAGDGPATFGMHTFPLPFERYRRLFTEGARLVVPEVRHAFGVPPAAKQRSRMGWWLATRQAHDIDPLAEPLLLTPEGFVTETPSANLIVVKDGELWTPPRDTVLSGISLQVVSEIMPVNERAMTVHDCANADELILTCTTWCLAGVSWFHGKQMTWPGTVYQKLLTEYSQRAEIEIEAQITKQSPER